MSINIKNEDAERLARELSRLTGKTITEAVALALREKLNRLKGNRKIRSDFQTIMEISRRCSQLPDLDKRSPEEILGYDSRGAFSHGD